jgi:hypothetical protein
MILGIHGACGIANAVCVDDGMLAQVEPESLVSAPLKGIWSDVGLVPVSIFGRNVQAFRLGVEYTLKWGRRKVNAVTLGDPVELFFWQPQP